MRSACLFGFKCMTWLETVGIAGRCMLASFGLPLNKLVVFPCHHGHVFGKAGFTMEPGVNIMFSSPVWHPHLLERTCK